MPNIKLACPYCKATIQVPDTAAGKKVQCPKAECKKQFVVPASAGGGSSSGASKPALSASGNGAKVSKPPAPAPAPAAPAPAAAAPATPTNCPACGEKLLEGAVSCMDCGFLITSDTGPAEPEGPPNLCNNAACGVANPPGERNCVRCGSPLPIAGGTLLNDRYRLEKLLKMGGFGAVYKGVDTKNNNREVAIKDMIGNDPGEFAIRLNFFRREAEILKALEPVPIVPRMYEFIHHGQTAHLVMEFIRGKDLLDIMEKDNDNKPFAIPQIIAWSKAVCDVLSHMHNQSPPLIHRDLKPDNIMLLEDKKSIKMIDFGTARDVGRTVKERSASKTRVYTEGYAPPEQIIGKPEARSDLFALAATMYHLATGKPPEGFHTAKEIETQLKENSPAIPKEFRWFFDLIRINMAEDINERYFSAKEIKKDLEKQKVSTDVPCPKCKTANKVRVPYCSECAEPLTEAANLCSSCGKSNCMGSRFCIHCGNRLK